MEVYYRPHRSKKSTTGLQLLYCVRMRSTLSQHVKSINNSCQFSINQCVLNQRTILQVRLDCTVKLIILNINNSFGLWFYGGRHLPPAPPPPPPPPPPHMDPDATENSLSTRISRHGKLWLLKAGNLDVPLLFEVCFPRSQSIESLNSS